MHTNLYFSVKTQQRHRGIPVQECCYKSTQSIYEMHVIIFHLHYQLIRQISICDIGYYKSRLGRIHTWYECNTAYLCEIIISECLQNRNYLGIITNGLTLATHPHLQVSFSSIFTPMSLFLAWLFSQSLCCHPTGRCNTEAGFSYLYHLSTHINCIIQAEYQASTAGGWHKQSFSLFFLPFEIHFYYYLRLFEERSGHEGSWNSNICNITGLSRYFK